MIVDDNASFRLVIKAVLQPMETEIIECRDGREAVSRYGQEQPDWVLMDIEMEGMDGLKATREIKAAFPEARVLVLSQFDDPDFRQEAEQAGAFGYLLKDDLLQVRRFLLQANPNSK